MTNKAISMIAAGVLMMTAAGCGAAQQETQIQTTETEIAAETTAVTESAAETETETEAVQIANPFSEYETLQEAEKGAGVTIELPEAPADYPVACYRAYKAAGLLEVIYYDRSAHSEDKIEGYRVRKAKSAEDISGDYTEYTEVVEMQMDADGRSVTFKGDDGSVYLAVWTEDEYSYAVNIDMDGAGMSMEEAMYLVAAIR